MKRQYFPQNDTKKQKTAQTHHSKAQKEHWTTSKGIAFKDFFAYIYGQGAIILQYGPQTQLYQGEKL